MKRKQTESKSVSSAIVESTDSEADLAYIGKTGYNTRTRGPGKKTYKTHFGYVKLFILIRNNVLELL